MLFYNKYEIDTIDLIKKKSMPKYTTYLIDMRLFTNLKSRRLIADSTKIPDKKTRKLN